MNGRNRFFVVVATLLAVTAPTVATAAPGNAPDDTTRKWVVSVGTSLSVGVQPDGAGGTTTTGDGYADQIVELLATTTDDKVQVKKFGCPAETTVRMVTGEGSACTYDHGSQLAEAAHWIARHRKNIGLVTLDVGINDLAGCRGLLIDENDPEAFEACIAEGFTNVLTLTPQIVAALRAAAGPDVPIVAMDYYNALAAAYLLGQPELMDLSDQLVVTLNGALHAIYGAFGVPVAPVASAYNVADVTPVPDPAPLPPDTPLNVVTVCVLTHMCTVGDIHPNVTGYGVIAQAIVAVAPSLPAKDIPNNG